MASERELKVESLELAGLKKIFVTQNNLFSDGWRKEPFKSSCSMKKGLVPLLLKFIMLGNYARNLKDDLDYSTFM